MAENNSYAPQLDDLSPEDNIFPEVQGEVPFAMLGPDIDEEYSLHTPEQKLEWKKGGSGYHTSKTFLSSENISSSSSLSDVSPAGYNLPKKEYFLHVNGNRVPTVDMKENFYAASEVGGEDTVKEMKNMVCEKLLEKVANYEVELKSAKENLQFSQEEIAKLKYENLTLVEELGRTIEKLQLSEDNMQKKAHNLRNEFQGKLNLANQSIDLLQAELCSERRLVSELQEMISKTTNDSSEQCRKIEELKLALHDAQEEFSKEIACLNDQNDALNTRLKEAELRNKSHEARETSLLDDIKQLNVELSQRCEVIDCLNKSLDASKLKHDMLMAEKDELVAKIQTLNAEVNCRDITISNLNKSLDASKLKYDMLMAEKDELFAKIQTLHAEVNCRDITISNMEGIISQLTVERGQLAAELDKTKEVAEELRVKVMEREKELEKQRVAVCDRAEEKREAIRQLCFSLEHYRNGYHELRQAFLRYNKQPAVWAS